MCLIGGGLRACMCMCMRHNKDSEFLTYNIEMPCSVCVVCRLRRTMAMVWPLVMLCVAQKGTFSFDTTRAVDFYCLLVASFPPPFCSHPCPEPELSFASADCRVLLLLQVLRFLTWSLIYPGIFFISSRIQLWSLCASRDFQCWNLGVFRLFLLTNDAYQEWKIYLLVVFPYIDSRLIILSYVSVIRVSRFLIANWRKLVSHHLLPSENNNIYFSMRQLWNM